MPPYTPGQRLRPDLFFLLRPTNPPGYVAGVGRGAIGFLTRPDIEGDAAIVESNMAASGKSAVPIKGLDIVGTRDLAGQRKAAVPGNDEWLAQHAALNTRIAAAFDANQNIQQKKKLGSKNDIDDDDGQAFIPDEGLLFDGDKTATAEDREADAIYASIEDRRRKLKKNQNPTKDELKKVDEGDVFREARLALKTVTAEQWAAIPDVVSTARRKRDPVNRERWIPLPDSTILSPIHQSSNNAPNVHVDDEEENDREGYGSVVVDLQALAQAKGRVLQGRLDQEQAKLVPTKTTQQANSSPNKQSTPLPPKLLLSDPDSAVGGFLDLEEAERQRNVLKGVLKNMPENAPSRAPILVSLARLTSKFKDQERLLKEALRCDPECEPAWLQMLSILRHKDNSLHSSNLHSSNLPLMIKRATRACPQSLAIWQAALDLADDKEVAAKSALEALPGEPSLWHYLLQLIESNGEEGDREHRTILEMACEQCPQHDPFWALLVKFLAASPPSSADENGVLQWETVWLACLAILSPLKSNGNDKEDRSDNPTNCCYELSLADVERVYKAGLPECSRLFLLPSSPTSTADKVNKNFTLKLDIDDQATSSVTEIDRWLKIRRLRAKNSSVGPEEWLTAMSNVSDEAERQELLEEAWTKHPSNTFLTQAYLNSCAKDSLPQRIAILRAMPVEHVGDSLAMHLLGTEEACKAAQTPIIKTRASYAVDGKQDVSLSIKDARVQYLHAVAALKNTNIAPNIAIEDDHLDALWQCRQAVGKLSAGEPLPRIKALLERSLAKHPFDPFLARLYLHTICNSNTNNGRCAVNLPANYYANNAVFVRHRFLVETPERARKAALVQALNHHLSKPQNSKSTINSSSNLSVLHAGIHFAIAVIMLESDEQKAQLHFEQHVWKPLPSGPVQWEVAQAWYRKCTKCDRIKDYCMNPVLSGPELLAGFAEWVRVAWWPKAYTALFAANRKHELNDEHDKDSISPLLDDSECVEWWLKLGSDADELSLYDQK